MGQVCKHRFGILFAVTDGIVSGNIEDVAVVCGWIPGSDIEQAMANIELAEEDVLRAKKKLSAAKKGLAKAFRT